MELLGFEEKKKIFQQLIEEETISHAYLFFGDQGIGKFLFAKWIAEACELRNEKKENEMLLDMLSIEPDEKGSIKIDAAQNVRDFLWETPFRSKKRVAIIRDAHCLTREAEGSLLKIIEEPPRHALILFTSHRPDELVAPIRSRLNKIYCKRMPKKDIKKILEEKYKIPEKKAQEISDVSFGRIGKALDLAGGEIKQKEESLKQFIEKKILEIRKKGTMKYSGALAFLLETATIQEKYNVNENIQKKAVEFKLRQFGL